MRVVLKEAFRRVFGREATRVELQCLQAIAWLETSYGAGWKGTGVGSYNIGACQAGSGWSGDTFIYTDTHPNADGSNTPYSVKFRKYPTLIAGAEDLVKIVFKNANREPNVLAPASKGETLAFSAGLFGTKDKKVAAAVLEKYGVSPTGYYEGFGKTWEDRIANHHKAVVGAIRLQAVALGEDLPKDIAAEPKPLPTLRAGSTDRVSVEALQAALNLHGARPPVVANGSFGPTTTAALKRFQSASGLVPDAVCGPATWVKLLVVA